MNKLFTKIVGVALGLTMAIGVGVAVASNNREAVAVKADSTPVLSWSRSGTTNTTTSGYTFEATASAKTGYYQDGNNTSGIKVYSTSTAICSSTPTSVTFTASVGGGSGNKDLSSSVYVAYVNASGEEISNTAVEVTSHITTNTGDTYNKSMSASSATSAYGVYIYHAKESGYNVRYYSFSLSYEASSGTSFTVTYNANGGTCSTSSESVAENGHPSFPNASKEYCTFNGWKTDGDNTLYTSANASSYTVTGAVTFVAQYSPATYTVTYNANGATSGTVPTDNSSPYNGGSTVTVLGNTGNLAKTNCTFVGWNTAANGSGTDYEKDDTFTIGANITLYAQWHDDTETLVITRSCFPSGTLAYNETDEWAATASNGDSVSGEGDLYSTASQETMQTKNSSVSTHYHNTTAVPGFITKIKLDVASGTDRTYNVFLSKTAISSTSGLTQEGTLTGASDFVGDAADEYCYFWLQCTGGASYLNSITIYFIEDKTPSVELSTTSISLKTTQSNGLKVSATVRNVATPTYLWEANNNNVTLAGANTNEVTIKPNTNQTANSTVTLTVGGATPALSPVSVNVSISVPGPGETAETAYTAAEAAAAISAASGDIEDIYVTGIISQIDGYYSSSHSINYWISADGTTSGQFKIYGGKGLNNADFNSVNDLSLGDTVIVFGTISKQYSNLNSGNYIVAYTAAPKVNSITLTPAIVTVAPEAAGDIVDLFTNIVINQDQGSTKTVNDIIWSSDDEDVLYLSGGEYLVMGAHKTSTTLRASIGGTEYGNATINVIDPNHPFITYDVPTEWNFVSDPSTLVAGDRVILTGVKSDVTYAATTYASGNNVPADTTNTLTVSGTKVTGVVSTMIYTLEEGTEDGSLAFKDSAGKYLYAASGSSNYMKTQSGIDGNASFILNSDGTVVAQGSNSRNYMRYNNDGASNLFSCYASTSTTGSLVTFYKMSGGDSGTVDLDDTILTLVRSKMSTYKDEHNEDQYGLSICNYNGGSDLSTWNSTVANGFTASIISTYHLADARANRAGNDVEKFLSAYDYVVENYGASYDFLGRIASGKVTPVQQSRVVLEGLMSQNAATPVIVIVSLASLTAIGGYFFLRKRKEQ